MGLACVSTPSSRGAEPLVAGRKIEGSEHGRRVQAIEAVAKRRGRREPLGNLADSPLDGRFRDVARAARLDGDARSAAAAIGVDQAVMINRRDHVAGRIDPPQRFAVFRIDALQGVRRGDEQLRLAADLDLHGSRVIEGNRGTLFLPPHRAGDCVVGRKRRGVVVPIDQQQHRVAIENRAAREGHVDRVVIGDVVPPDQLAAQIEGRDRRRAKGHVNPLAIGRRCRRRNRRAGRSKATGREARSCPIAVRRSSSL